MTFLVEECSIWRLRDGLGRDLGALVAAQGSA
jgi:hypothetical protein